MLKIYPRDVIGIIVVLFGMILIAKGINQIVSGIVIMVVTWYFTQRMNGNEHSFPEISERVKKLEIKVNGSSPGASDSFKLNPRIINKEFQKTKEILEPQSSVPSKVLS